jgi:carboxymethylenebutenolidase
MQPTIETVAVGDSTMEVFLFSPGGNAKYPGLILAQHIPVGHTGIENDEFTLVSAARYAQAGYVVAVPFIFHWWPKSEDMKVKATEFRDDWTRLDLEATYELLCARGDIKPDRIGIVGHCWGGRVAWLGACCLPVQACVVFYGGRIKLALGAETPPAIELAPDIQCPVIGFFGNEDKNPTPEDVDDYAKALAAAGMPYEFHRYDGVGHAFQNFPTPQRYHAQASEDAWQKALAFLATHLG